MRIVTAESLESELSHLPENPRIVTSGNGAIPWTTIRAIDSFCAAYTLHALNAAPGVPDRDGVTLETTFVGPGMRKSPRLRYVPCRLSLVPVLYRTTCPPDVVVVHTSVPAAGRVSLGAEVNVLPAAIDAVKARGGMVVAQIDPSMPYTYGDGEIHVDQIDLAVEAEDPLASPGAIPIDDAARSVADRVAAHIADGSTLQMGIGAVPDAVLEAIDGRNGLRVWSEMVSDGLLALEHSGCTDAQHPMVSTFLFGSPDLYAWAHENPRLRMMRTEIANDPGHIAQQQLMVSVNTGLQVDLFGQVNASRIGPKIHSGFGGQTDFIVGALHSLGGQAFIALRSWHPKADTSTIIPLLESPTTSFQASAIVTEQGEAPLFGMAQQEQCRALIEQAAHPRVRDELWEEAGELGLR